MAKEKVQTPAGMAGLVQYYDEDRSLVKLKPEVIVGIGIGLIVLEIFLYLTIVI